MNLRRRALVVMAGGLAATGLMATTVRAAPSLTVSPQGGAPGDQLTATGTGFQPGAVGIHVDAVAPGGEIAGGVIASDGTFVVSLTIPIIADGPHQLIACRDITPAGECGEQASASIRVIASEPSTTTTTPALVALTTTTSTTSPVIVAETTTTGPTPPTIPPVIVSSSTSAPLDEAQPEGEIVPDISIRGVEITQGIQDLASRMPLVAGRRTTVRVHVDVAGGFVAGIDGALLVERAGEADVVLHPDNGPIPPGLDRTDLDGALNFTLDSDLYAAGEATFTAQVWSAEGAWITEEPDGDNNYRSRTVEFQVGDNPTVWLVALDDGAGPGPDIDDLTVLLGYAPIVNQDLLDYLPIASVAFEAYWEPVLPGPEAVEPGLWNLGLSADVDATAGARRHEPNQRMALLAELGGFLDDGLVLGLIDNSIPTDVYTGWAGYGVSWSKPAAGTPSHEAAHSIGLDHVNCLGDTDGDGVSQEEEGGSIDWSHPNGLPPVCSLAPIDPDGFFGYTNYRSPVTIYSNDPAHPLAAYPFMGYQNPGWTDPYHWCRMLDTFGIDCNPTVLGLPPADPFQVVECEPEDVGRFQLDLCVSTEPADAEPLDVQPSEQLVATVGTNDVGMETLQIAHEGFLFDIPVDPASWVIAAGSVDLHDGTGAIAEAATRDEISATTASQLASTIDSYALGEAPAGLALQLSGADGSALAVVPVVVDGAGHGNGTDHGSEYGFFSPIPWVDGAASVDLVVGGTIVDSLAISETAPQVGAVRVETVGSAQTYTVSWEVADPDAGALDAMAFTVLWSADGETWLTVAGDVEADRAGGEDGRGLWQINIDPSDRLPGGDDVRVRVIADDGVRTGEATSEAFSAPDRPPLVSVAPLRRQPADGQPLTFEEHDLVELEAIVVDPEQRSGHEEEIEVVSVRWSTAGTPLGDGAVLRTRDLPVGAHPITITITDAAGNETVAEVTVDVVARTSPTRAAESANEAAVAYFDSFQCIPDSADQLVAASCADAGG